MIIKIE